MLPTPGRNCGNCPPRVTWTTRLRKDAALHELPPPRTGRRGRPRVKGAAAARPGRPGQDGQLHAGHRDPLPQDRHRAGRRRHLPVAYGLRLPPGPGHPRPRPRPARGYDIALVTTDLDASPAADHRAVCGEMVHRGRVRGRPAGLRRRAGPQPHRPRGPRHRSRSPWPARPWPSSGTPPPATTPPTSMSTAPAPPGTPPRPSHPPPT